MAELPESSQPSPDGFDELHTELLSALLDHYNATRRAEQSRLRVEELRGYREGLLAASQAQQAALDQMRAEVDEMKRSKVQVGDDGSMAIGRRDVS